MGELRLSNAARNSVSGNRPAPMADVPGAMRRGALGAQRMQLNDQNMQRNEQLLDLGDAKLKKEEMAFITQEREEAADQKYAEGYKNAISTINFNSPTWEMDMLKATSQLNETPEQWQRWQEQVQTLQENDQKKKEWKTEAELAQYKIREAEAKARTAEAGGNKGKPPSVQNAGIAITSDGRKVPVTYNPDPTAEGNRFTNSITGEPMEEGAVPIKASAQGSSIEEMGGTEAKELRNAQVGTENFIATGKDAIKLLRDTPNINTFVARSASFVNDLQQESRALAESTGADISLVDPNTYESTFDDLGIESARIKGLITSLAFQAATASGEKGRRSDKDIERFIKEVGGNHADPRAFAKTLEDLMKRTDRNFRNNFKVRTKTDWTGDNGLDEFFSEDRKKEVGEMTLDEINAELESRKGKK